MIASVVDWGKLGGVALTALAAGTGVTLMYSLAVLGAVRAGDRRSQANWTWLAYAGLAVLCVAGCAGAVAWGVVLLSQK
jgi:hypothetical protein